MLDIVAQGIGYFDENGNWFDIAGYFREQGFDIKISKGSDFHFKYYLSISGEEIGRVSFYNNNAELNIVGFHTQYQAKNPNEYKHEGYGKNALRAIFKFATTAGHYTEITTSIFSKTGTGFFLSQGFYSRSPKTIERGSPQRTWHKKELDINWERAVGLFGEQEIQQSRKQLDKNPNDKGILELARTPIGRTVLWNCGECGYANLNDQAQMSSMKSIIGFK